MKFFNLFTKAKDKNYDWTTIEIKGLRYDDNRIRTAKKLKFNEALKLVCDDDNSHDEFAVKVENLSGNLIGFIPMTLSRLVRNMINEGSILGVFATEKDVNGEYPKIDIQLQLPKGWFESHDSNGDIIVNFGGDKSRIQSD